MLIIPIKSWETDEDLAFETWGSRSIGCFGLAIAKLYGRLACLTLGVKGGETGIVVVGFLLDDWEGLVVLEQTGSGSKSSYQVQVFAVTVVFSELSDVVAWQALEAQEMGKEVGSVTSGGELFGFIADL